MRFPLLALWLASTLVMRADVPRNLVAEGIPPIPAELVREVAPYLTLGGTTFRGWHSTRREILLTMRAGGVTQLYRADGPLSRRVLITRAPEPVKSGSFQPGGELLVFQRDRGGDELYQYYALDVADAESQPVLLTDGEARNTGAVWSHDGRWLAYASTRRNGKDSDIYIVDPTDPATTRCVLTNKSPGWSVADWSRDSSRLLVSHSRSDDETVLWIVDRKSGEKKRATADGAKDYFKQACFAENDMAIYAVTDAESDFLTLTRLDPSNGTRSALTPPIFWDVEEFALSHDGRTLAYTLNENGFSRLHLIDVATRAELPVPKIPGDLLSGLEWHRERRELGFTLNGAQSPSDAWSLEVDRSTLTRWTDRLRKPKLGQRYAEPEITRVWAHDGLSIAALVYRPNPQKFPGRRPVVVSIHGGPASQSRPGFRGSANYYLEGLGIAIVYPNIRGSTGYGRKFMALDNGMKREDSIRDIGAVIDWIVADPHFDADRIAVMGGSYGGFMTLACLVAYPERLRCGVDSVGIANFVTFLQDTSEYRRGNRRQEYGDERQPEMRAFLDRISPATQAEKIRDPLFIIQGKNDPRVPFTEAEQMRDAIRRTGGQVWYLMAQDEGHGFSKKANVDFQFQATVLFLREHLLK